MRRSSLQSELERIVWAGEALRLGSVRSRGGPPVSASHVAAPHSASLSASGVLSWRWYVRDDSFKNRRLHRCVYGSTSMRPHKIDPRLCERFAELADATGEQVRRFAERWGPLHYPRSSTEPSDTETLEHWRRFAILARALLRCAAALGQGESGLSEDWRALSGWVNYPLADKLTYMPGVLLIAAALNIWYARSVANSLVEIQKDKIILRPSSGSLFGIFGLQLAYRITGAAETRVCYHCKRFYTPKNQPRTGARSFCEHCRRAGKPAMYAMRDHRARRKDRA
jgi:hypothetical protein